MTWERPIPVVGDTTAASQRAADPIGWAFDESQRAALYAIIEARRDVRRFRPDPIPDDVLRRVLTAAHVAPSVGHSQPWRFVVVRDPDLRTRAALLADRERLRQATQLAPDAARRLLDLKLEGIREAPTGIVVCCDRRTPAAGVLGRATFADADIWSCAAAIENLWLAARAEGLGLGWVTLFQPEDLSTLVEMPDGVVTLGWLCLGWPDERPPAPGLQRAGWSKRLPLDDVVYLDRWPAPDGETAAPISHLRTPDDGDRRTSSGGERSDDGGDSDAVPSLRHDALRAPESAAVVAARDDGDRLLTPPGSLGVLDRAVERVLAVHGDATGGTLVLAAADHPVAALGVSAFRSDVTAEVLAAAEAGVALGVRAAVGAGLAVELVDAGVDPGSLAVARKAGAATLGTDGVAASLTSGAAGLRPATSHTAGLRAATSNAAGFMAVTSIAARDGRGDLTHSDAMTLVDAHRFVDAGREIGQAAARRGLVALGEVGIGNTTVAACLAAALTGMDVADAVGLGSGADSAILERKRDVVATAISRWRATNSADPVRTLAMLGGPEIAVLTGVALGATAAGAVTVLDGLATGVAALVAVAIEPAVADHLVAGQRSRERAHQHVLRDLGCEPLLDLRIRAGEGVGACLGASLLLQTLAMRRSVARVDY